MNYWAQKEERKKKARRHTFEVERRYHDEIQKSIENTVIYGWSGRIPEESTDKKVPMTMVVDDDSVSALINYHNGNVAVLNYASYKNPGGMFFEGSSAQEESLCHESFLYNVLVTFNDTYYAWNRQNLNRALYKDRGLYSPGIIFNRAGTSPVSCSVITCAAPNYLAAYRYRHVSREENSIALRSRIKFVKGIAEENHVNTLIAGAYGCGVFGQDPIEVAQIFEQEFKETSISRIVHAIPAGPNLTAFKNIFRK